MVGFKNKGQGQKQNFTWSHLISQTLKNKNYGTLKNYSINKNKHNKHYNIIILLKNTDTLVFHKYFLANLTNQEDTKYHFHINNQALLLNDPRALTAPALRINW